MTPPEHFFTGASLAHIVYSLQVLLKTKRFNYLALLLLMGIAAMFPDIDSFFGHYASRNPAIGHRGMTHSFIGVIVFGFFLTAVTMALTCIFIHLRRSVKLFFRTGKNNSQDQNDDAAFPESMEAYFSVRSFCILFAVSILGGISHIIADLFQPPGVWDGIPLFFPLKSGGKFIRHGGYAMTGWYDYKIMWLMIQAFLLSLPLLMTGSLLSRFKINKKTPSLVFILVIIINSTAFLLMADHIRRSEYRNRYAWEKKQTEYLRQSHPLIQQITLKGRKQFLRLLFKSTH